MDEWLSLFLYFLFIVRQGHLSCALNIQQPVNPAASNFNKEALRVALQPLSTAQINLHSVFYQSESINFYVFNSHALSTQLHHLTREELIASWLCHDLKFKTPQAEKFAMLKIYDAASTASVTHSNSALITQEPSNHPAWSCSNLSLLFIKCVTMNRVKWLTV